MYIYYKELAPVTMEAKKPHDLLSVSLTLREGEDQYPSSTIRQRERAPMRVVSLTLN